MEFGDGHLASAGSSDNSPSECVLDAGEIITEVRADTKLHFDFKAPTRITFITSQQTCALGPATGGTQIFSGERLLYTKGKVGGVFDRIYFIFSSC